MHARTHPEPRVCQRPALPAALLLQRRLQAPGQLHAHGGEHGLRAEHAVGRVAHLGGGGGVAKWGEGEGGEVTSDQQMNHHEGRLGAGRSPPPLRHQPSRAHHEDQLGAGRQAVQARRHVGQAGIGGAGIKHPPRTAAAQHLAGPPAAKGGGGRAESCVHPLHVQTHAVVQQHLITGRPAVGTSGFIHPPYTPRHDGWEARPVQPRAGSCRAAAPKDPAQEVALQTQLGTADGEPLRRSAAQQGTGGAPRQATPHGGTGCTRTYGRCTQTCGTHSSTAGFPRPPAAPLGPPAPTSLPSASLNMGGPTGPLMPG